MRAIVIGASGQIGGWLMRGLRSRGVDAIGTYAGVPYTGLVHLDAADPGAADWVGGQRPDIVFYPAGYTYVDGCERDPGRARSANLEQPLAIGRAAVEAGGRFIYFSTDYVFDGTAGPYAEEDSPNPLSVYGQSKLDAEHVLARELGSSQLTIRTSWVYGPERQGKNFAYQLVRALAAGKTLTCPSDQVSSPSYAPDVAEAAIQLVERGTSGVLHVAGPEVLDRVQFACALAEGFGLDAGRIIGMPTAKLGQQAPRPLRGGLRIDALTAWRPRLMRPLRLALADFRSRIGGDEGWADPSASPRT